MKKYNEEIFSVYHKGTGKKIADCGSREDARMMVHMDWKNREYRVNKMLMSEVVDVEVQKQLPTNNIVVNMDGGVGGSWKVEENSLPQIKLPEGQGIPVKV